MIAEADGEADVALYLERELLDRLDRHDPLTKLDGDNLADFWSALEGVSHFTYYAWNAARDKTVSLFELELQAEVDKFVTTGKLLREQTGPRAGRLARLAIRLADAGRGARGARARAVPPREPLRREVLPPANADAGRATTKPPRTASYGASTGCRRPRSSRTSTQTDRPSYRASRKPPSLPVSVRLGERLRRIVRGADDRFSRAEVHEPGAAALLGPVSRCDEAHAAASRRRRSRSRSLSACLLAARRSRCRHESARLVDASPLSPVRRCDAAQAAARRDVPLASDDRLERRRARTPAPSEPPRRGACTSG